MKKSLTLLFCLFFLFSTQRSLVGQVNVEWKPVNLKNETKRKWKEGWLKVPENRKAAQSNTISLPFIYSKSSEENSLAPILIMSGGPGNGSIHMANGMVYMPWAKGRDLVFIDQRGTLFSKPVLKCPELDSARFRSLKEGLYGKPVEEAQWKATEDCYQRWVSEGVDLNGYHTLESVEDLEALRKALEIEKWIVYGMSYSCNLMATYTQTYPDRVKAVILDSPLPHQANYDEDAATQFDQAFQMTLGKNKEELYPNWINYLSSIKDSVFYTSIKDKKYLYSKKELIEVIENAMGDHDEIKKVPKLVTQIIKGDHQQVPGIISGKLRTGWQAKGMRYSVWMAEEWPEQNVSIMKKNQKSIPWLKNHPLNDISKKTAKIWKVKPIYSQYQWPDQQVDLPCFIMSGAWDPWTPPAYGQMMKDIFPAAKLKIYEQMTHLPGFTKIGREDIQAWLQGLESDDSKR